jgi:hypothetical protein
LDAFRESAVAVLTERDPAFEIPTAERYAAAIYGKVLTNSSALRMGLAEGLAILGSKPGALINCSQGKAESTAVLTIREIFADADWVLWGSLNNLLPLLAEAAPGEFLDTVERALDLSPCPFDELFSQEEGGVTGRIYLSGLLWALEGLAWDEQHLVRACVILGELASRDPGGTWSNRPANSLVTILLPWFPQTIAPIQKRKVAVQTLSRECPEIAWKLVISLLPDQHQTSMGSHKPSWRNTIPKDWKELATNQDYWVQVSFYAECALTMAGYDIAKLGELIDHFDKLPRSSFDKLREVLSSDVISELPEDKRLHLWDRLTKFTSKHRRFSDAEWALNDELLSPIETVTEKLAPSDPFNCYQYLFSEGGFDFDDENSNWDEQQKKLDQRRQIAIEAILKLGDIETVIQFAETVKSADQVGHSLGCVANAKIDTALLPNYLGSENRQLSFFISGYVWSRRYTCGWVWADELDKSDWDSAQVALFLSYLPFANETWNRATIWLGDLQGTYWQKTHVKPHQADSGLETAIDKLIEHERPNAAISCLYQMYRTQQSINLDQCVSALLAAVSSSEASFSSRSHYVVELIKLLQSTTEVAPDDLFRVEWAYLVLLDDSRGATPKLLDNRLASDPSFFCEVIRLIYRSKKVDAPTNNPSEQAKAIATNAWDLLRKWRTPPGMQEDGSFSDSHFSAWLQRVKEICIESGHLEFALNEVGKVLIHCPSDTDGLWINQTVADALNAKDAEKMRSSFISGISAPLVSHIVDPTGKIELELAEQYRQKADHIENAGYHRFAVTLSKLSESYEHEAKRVIAEHQREVSDDDD